jgi:hypothetical protein
VAGAALHFFAPLGGLASAAAVVAGDAVGSLASAALIVAVGEIEISEPARHARVVNRARGRGKGEARQIAVNMARLPELLGKEGRLRLNLIHLRCRGQILEGAMNGTIVTPFHTRWPGTV